MAREVLWCPYDKCFIAKENGLATHGDIEEAAIDELEIVLKMVEEMEKEDV